MNNEIISTERQKAAMRAKAASLIEGIPIFGSVIYAVLNPNMSGETAIGLVLTEVLFIALSARNNRRARELENPDKEVKLFSSPLHEVVVKGVRRLSQG